MQQWLSAWRAIFWQVVNFKFEFPVRDVEAGGRKAKNMEGVGVTQFSLNCLLARCSEATAFQKRARHLADVVERDSEAQMLPAPGFAT